MKVQLLRNATQILTVNDKKILIDPMFAVKGEYEPFPFTGNSNRNPTVDFPMSDTELSTLLAQVDAVLLTHLHLDHWDVNAQKRIKKNIPIICQPWDIGELSEEGFTNLIAVEDHIHFNGIDIYRTDGHHGTGEIEAKMGKVSGYVIQFQDECLYIAGDTIWCDEVAGTLEKFNPQYTIVNGGGAKFTIGDPIVMNIEDIEKLCQFAPFSKVFIVHLESVNHSQQTRQEILQWSISAGLSRQITVPLDGELFL